MSFLRISFLTVLLACIPHVSSSENWDRVGHPKLLEYPDQSFAPPKPERYEMDNRLVVYYLRDNSIPMIRAYARIRAGGIHESSDEVGLANLTGGLLRLGGSTKTSAETMNENLEFAGAALESAGARDYSAVSLRVLTRDKEMGFDYFAEILRDPAFPQDKIDQKKGEVAEELRRQLDDPMEITRNKFRELMYGDHPYGRNPLGTVESLESFSREDLVAWHERIFKPDRTIISVSGDFDPEWLKKTLEEKFGDWERSEENIQAPEVGDQDEAGGTFFIEKDLNQSTVRFGHLGIAKGHPDAIPLDVLNFIIGGGGFSSRMVNEVRTKGGYAYLVVSIFDEPLLQGQFVTILQTQTKNTLEATRLAQKVIAEAIEPGALTDEEIELAKESKLNDFVFKFETPHSVVQAYAELEFYGMPDNYLETYRDRLRKVSREDLERVGKKHIHSDRLTLLILGNPDVRPLLEEEVETFETLQAE